MLAHRLLPALAALAALALASLQAAPRQTALDRYVQAPDANYSYKAAGKIAGQGYTAHVLEMTSQQWRSASEVDRPVWTHYLLVIKPDKIEHSTGLLFIGGGSNDGKPPVRVDSQLSTIALYTNSVVAELRQVPNEPVTFSDDRKRRTEDAIIAYTWDKYLRTGDDTWPLRLPMTKAAVRAMDTVTSFLASAEGGGVTVDRFFVSGASKRGWTTWTTAAVDRRVVAIAPLVIDLLNIQKSFVHHWRAYGFWAPAIRDYENERIMDWTGTRQYRELMRIEEPYSYRDRLTMPKLIVNSTGDQFFLPDSSQFYFDGLRGEKNLRYVPNTDHSLRGSDVVETLCAFYDQVLRNQPRPRWSWRFQKDGSIRVQTVDKPLEVKLWQATNPEKRDFRLMTIGTRYQSSVLAEENGAYVARVPKPEKGWTAFFVEATFPTGRKYPLKLTTGVRVVPDVYPFPPPKPGRK